MKALLELLKNIVVFLSGYLTALYLNSENQTFEDNIKYQISYIKKITNNPLQPNNFIIKKIIPRKKTTNIFNIEKYKFLIMLLSFIK